MPEDQKTDFEREASRLSAIVRRMEQLGEKLQELVSDRKERVVAIRRDFWDDVSLNAEYDDELMETAASIRAQAGVLRQQERTLLHAHDTLQKLERSMDAPYFGRIDFTETESGLRENVYIGIMSLVDPDTDELLVYDWRAPIAGMFYDYPPGPASYQVPKGETISGEMTLKRQYLIDGGRLLDYFDTGLRIGDGLLAQLLGRSADDKMKSIVTTIQSEQNEIIRDTESRVVIVQGAAGSGKTSVALQRVAYLLYRYRNVLTSDNMVLFSPNRLFSDYVSNVLPELGEANMRQTTFQEHLERELSAASKVEDAYDQLEAQLTEPEGDPRQAVRSAGIRFKSSAAFADAIAAYAKLLEREGMRFIDFTVKDRVVLEGSRIAERFYAHRTERPMWERMELLSEWLAAELEELKEEAAKRYYRRLLKAPNYLGTEPELKAMARKQAKKRYGPLIEQAKRFEFWDLGELYARLFKDDELWSKLEQTGPERLAPLRPSAGLWEGICRDTLLRLQRGAVPYEDATPIVDLKGRIEGRQTMSAIRHVLIDEAQDYTPYQFSYLKRLFPRAKFTLLGDWNQGIYQHAQGGGEYRSIAELFQEEGTRIYRLTKSYRSTSEIAGLAAAVLPEREPVEPFERGGEPPQLYTAAPAELPLQVWRDVMRLRADGAGTMAVLCKTQAEAREAFERLQAARAAAGAEAAGLPPLQLVTKESAGFSSSLAVLPAALAKGLEFDAVVVYNAGAAVYCSERERKLFYTVCTRALHRLHLHAVGEPTPFLQGTELYRGAGVEV
ncbi:RNA polymerase recycling motor HelD [Gordoniibacillus kamchatkensis]|uniref:RNA polymerase recycling motor HelD n=1 Tax=Gordoniibacillus kamchatkensis TaxID=1590651 RepID=UPI000696D594|nr:RNA polymerase recycling motor HelD [Paenibacillus sp. VKM B-2647]